MQVGPAGSSLKFAGGQDIRDEIYSWPTTNPCRIDQKTVEDDWKDSDYFEKNLVNAYGLDALEHLLFAGMNSVCASQIQPNSDGSWSALGESGIRQNRAQFAKVLGEGVLEQASNLKTIWAISGGNYSLLLTASTADSPYESRDQALNAIYDSLFYLEVITKDRKLAQPLGFRDCSTELCLEDLEGLTSGTTILSITSNIRGFRSLFSGGDGFGMDDLLVELGHGDLSEQILIDIENTLLLSEQLEEPFDIAVAEQNEKVIEFYDSLALITTALKVDLSTVLSMEVPSEASGDND
jgi:predicted lipoprotein